MEINYLIGATHAASFYLRPTKNRFSIIDCSSRVITKKAPDAKRINFASCRSSWKCQYWRVERKHRSLGKEGHWYTSMFSLHLFFGLHNNFVSHTNTIETRDEAKKEWEASPRHAQDSFLFSSCCVVESWLWGCSENYARIWRIAHQNVSVSSTHRDTWKSNSLLVSILH